MNMKELKNLKKVTFLIIHHSFQLSLFISSMFFYFSLINITKRKKHMKKIKQYNLYLKKI